MKWTKKIDLWPRHAEKKTAARRPPMYFMNKLDI
jgi:hypothetical protein